MRFEKGSICVVSLTEVLVLSPSWRFVRLSTCVPRGLACCEFASRPKLLSSESDTDILEV